MCESPLYSTIEFCLKINTYMTEKQVYAFVTTTNEAAAFCSCLKSFLKQISYRTLYGFWKVSVGS